MTSDDLPLRFADGPTTSASVDVAASPVALWALLSDISLPARFSSEFTGAEWLDGATGLAVGARFEGRSEHPAAGSWSTVSTVVACEPGRLFAWDVGGGGDDSLPAASWSFAVEPLEVGSDGVPRSRLTQSVRLGPGRSGLTPALEARPDKEDAILRRRLAEHRANMTATIEGIRLLAEQPPT